MREKREIVEEYVIDLIKLLGKASHHCKESLPLLDSWSKSKDKYCSIDVHIIFYLAFNSNYYKDFGITLPNLVKIIPVLHS
jgi:hypothetical protein